MMLLHISSSLQFLAEIGHSRVWEVAVVCIGFTFASISYMRKHKGAILGREGLGYKWPLAVEWPSVQLLRTSDAACFPVNRGEKGLSEQDQGRFDVLEVSALEGKNDWAVLAWLVEGKVGRCGLWKAVLCWLVQGRLVLACGRQAVLHMHKSFSMALLVAWGSRARCVSYHSCIFAQVSAQGPGIAAQEGSSRGAKTTFTPPETATI
eukprot:1146487-Pelagomonas_calceolata.AAC.3